MIFLGSNSYLRALLSHLFHANINKMQILCHYISLFKIERSTVDDDYRKVKGEKEACKVHVDMKRKMANASH